MADDRIRELERLAVESPEAAAKLTKELERIGQAFEGCDWCWGYGFRLMGEPRSVERCEFCSKGSPKPNEPKKHIADEVKRFSSGSRWRHDAQARVRAVLSGLPQGADESAAREALRGAYPFGPRKYHPYKIWLDEVKKQLRKRFGVDAPAPLLGKAAVDVE